MDVNRPKRRKSKDNPYTIFEEQGKLYVTFKDGQGIKQKIEVNNDINFQPNKWRKNPKSRPTQQGIVVGCKNRTIGRLINLAHKVFYSFRKFRNLFRKKKNKKVIALKEPVSTTTAMVDTGDVHTLMIGAAGVGKTAYWLYPCIEYACATGMSFLCSDTKGDIIRNYGTIAEKYYGYKISVIDLRNPTRSHGNNLLHLVNKYMDLYKAEPEQLVYKARAEMSRLTYLYQMDLPHRAVAVYTYLHDRANKNGEC